MDIAHHKTHSSLDCRPILSALLAIILAVTSVVALMHGLHGVNHSAGGPDRHACLLCSLASGDVAAVQCILLCALFPLSLLFRSAASGVLSSGCPLDRLPFSLGPPVPKFF